MKIPKKAIRSRVVKTIWKVLGPEAAVKHLIRHNWMKQLDDVYDLVIHEDGVWLWHIKDKKIVSSTYWGGTGYHTGKLGSTYLSRILIQKYGPLR